jgi:hypothetical protein
VTCLALATNVANTEPARPPAGLISRLSHGAWVATWRGSGGAWHKVPCRLYLPAR